MINIYDYLFYRIFKINVHNARKRGLGKFLPFFNATLTMSFYISINLFHFILLFKAIIFFWVLEVLCFIVLGLITVFNFLLFFKKYYNQEFDQYFVHLTKNQNRIGSIIIILFVLISILGILWH
jgi:hypothetical protein